MGRSAIHTRSQFKAHPGSVLLATGAAWEGIDFPGDCVSLLIIPLLSFAVPDALKEKERENYPTLRLFIRAVVVPEMQIKLKQGFGRAIRTETDIMDTKQVKRDNNNKKIVELRIAGHPVTLSFASEPNATAAQRVRNCLIDSYISQNAVQHRIAL